MPNGGIKLRRDGVESRTGKPKSSPDVDACSCSERSSCGTTMAGGIGRGALASVGCKAGGVVHQQGH